MLSKRLRILGKHGREWLVLSISRWREGYAPRSGIAVYHYRLLQSQECEKKRAFKNCAQHQVNPGSEIGWVCGQRPCKSTRTPLTSFFFSPVSFCEIYYPRALPAPLIRLNSIGGIRRGRAGRCARFFFTRDVCKKDPVNNL